MVSITLLNFESYYTRRIKLYNTISEYADYVITTYNNINFIYNDGVNTTQILNYNPAQYDNQEPTYVLIQDYDTGELSRWFVINSIRTRKGQYQLSLHRDLIADNIDNVLNATTYVERGYCNDILDPAFYNEESILIDKPLNSVYELRDDSQAAWLVAYVAGTNSAISKEKIDDKTWEDTTVNYTTGQIIYQYEDTTNYDSFSSFWKAKLGISDINSSVIDTNVPLHTSFCISVAQDTGVSIAFKRYWYAVNINSERLANVVLLSDSGSIKGAPWFWTYGDDDVLPDTGYFYTSDALTAFNAIIQSFPSSDLLISKSIPSGHYMIDGVTYYLSSEDGNDITRRSWPSNLDNSNSPQLMSILNNIFHFPDINQGYITKGDFGAYLFTMSRQYALTPSPTLSTSTFKISKSRNTGNSYDILCTPINVRGDRTIYCNGKTYTADNAINLYKAFSQYWGTSPVYDVQILPFCPVSYITPYAVDESQLRFNVKNMTAERDYTLTEEGIPVFYINTTDREFEINRVWRANNNIDSITFPNWSTIGGSYMKTKYMAADYKLYSPNFNSEYIIPLMKNGGLNRIHVDMTCLPNQPWIRVRPVWEGLNGINYDDAKGLILGGSYSLTQLTNAWTEYQYTNINYQNIQDSTIQYQQAQYDITNQKNLISGALNTVSSTISGAVGGALVGGIPGAIAGGLASAGASIGGLVADQYYDKKSQKLTIDYSQEQFALQTGNVKAQASTISRLTAVNSNFKYFPQLLVYVANDKDIDALDAKWENCGMSIGRIGKLINYLNEGKNQFVKGKLIRNDNMHYSFDYYNAIGQEVAQGFFYGGN